MNFLENVKEVVTDFAVDYCKKHPNINVLDLEYHYMSCKMILQ